MAKIIKVKNQLLVVESLVPSTLVPCMSRSQLFMAMLAGQFC
jgi:hypothetical protein